MSAFYTFINDLTKKDSEFLHSELENLNTILQDGRDYYANVLSEVKKYDKTGKFSVVEVPSYSRRSSTKENAEPAPNPAVMQVHTKPKKNAFQENNQILDQHPTHDGIIKTERVSDSQQKIMVTPDMSTVKTEKEDMPAPTQIPPRKKKIKAEPVARSSRSARTRNNKIESDNGVSNDETRPKRTRKKPIRYTSKERKDSDVILENAPIITVELSDSDEASSTTSENNIVKISKTEATSEVKNIRSTRTKTRNKVDTDPPSSRDDQENSTIGKNKSTSKRGRMESDDELAVQKDKQREAKRSRSDSDNNDVQENPKKTNPQDSNIKSSVVNKGETKDENKNDVEKDLFTDDESEAECKTPPQIPVAKNNKKVAGKKAEPHADKLQENVPILDTTVIVEKPKYTETALKTIESDQLTHNLNTTIVIKKQVTDNKQNDPTDNLMTDDESEEEIISPMKLQMKTNHIKGVKPIFSPFDPSPVKKKVEAFERLGAEASGIPTRVTRTKTRALAKEQKENENTKEDEINKNQPEEAQSTVKQKAKFFTPTRFVPKSTSTNKLTHKLPVASANISTCDDSILSVKSASSLKASQAEYREREKQRREKEAEALRKRELMIQAQIEEKKRKREEKQLKAQQHREVLEKESLKKVEAQKIKEEKFKKLLAEKEVNARKQREEIERKRQLAKKRAMEEKRKEELRIAEEQKKADEILKKKENALKAQGQGPVYLHTKAPLLPTDDCYDSDDPEFKTHIPKKPLWSNEKDLWATQLCMIAAKENLKNTFFCCQAVTPDLQELFENIDPRKLKRTSSAIWRKPPRYTLMPNIDQDLLENSSEDDY